LGAIPSLLSAKRQEDRLARPSGDSFCPFEVLFPIASGIHASSPTTKPNGEYTKDRGFHIVFLSFEFALSSTVPDWNSG
jgi:hypothetical protein